MPEAVITYIRQRFSPGLFGALALFLFLFAKGNPVPETSDYLWLPFLVSLLFVFRLLDDLHNREFDQHKSNRNYTDPDQYRQLQLFLIGFTLVVFALLIAVNPIAGIGTLCFLMLNLLLYKLLLPYWKFRNLLPLLKYPFLVLLLGLLLWKEQILPLEDLVVCLSLFPAFVLYETLTDENFPVNLFTKVLLFAAVFLPFLPGFSFNLSGAFSAGFALAFLLVLLFFRHRMAPYLLLLLLLFTRLTLSL